MSRPEVEADIRETLGLVPEFFADVPDFLIESEWASFKALELSGVNNVLFRRNSVTGTIEAQPWDRDGVSLNAALHSN